MPVNAPTKIGAARVEYDDRMASRTDPPNLGNTQGESRHAIWPCIGVAAVFVLALLGTRTTPPGDALNYAGTIAEHLGKAPYGPGNSLWEFGHLLWRPLGWLVATILSPLLSRATHWTPFLQASFALIAISVVSGVAAVTLWYSTLIDLGVPQKLAFSISLALAFGHGFLLYAHTAMVYVPGVACLTASVYLLRKGKVTGAAVCYALATLLWLPYLLAGLALAVLAAMPTDWNLRVRDTLKTLKIARAIRFVAISLAIIVLVYLLAGAAREIRSAGEAKAWYSDASHGWSQSQTAVRLATGLPRLLLNLGTDGIQWKRFLRHDPYAPAGAWDLVRTSFWKPAAFYLFLAVLFYGLSRWSPSGWALILLLAAAGPVIFFAVVLFEPSSPERFLPVLPFLVLVTGWIMRDFTVKFRVSQILIAAFLLAVVVNNGYSFAAQRMAREDDVSWARIAAVRHRVSGASIVVLVTNQDTIEGFFSRALFGEVDRPQPLTVYDVAEPGTVRMNQWREEFAAKVIGVWNSGGEVWISRRLWSATPKPEWNWVERDDPREVWEDFYRFFHPLETDQDLGGNDGFARLTHGEENLRYLKPFAAAYKQTLAGARTSSSSAEFGRR